MHAFWNGYTELIKRYVTSLTEQLFVVLTFKFTVLEICKNTTYFLNLFFLFNWNYVIINQHLHPIPYNQHFCFVKLSSVFPKFIRSVWDGAVFVFLRMTYFPWPNILRFIYIVRTGRISFPSKCSERLTKAFFPSLAL